MARPSRIDKRALAISVSPRRKPEPKDGDSQRHEAFIRDLPDLIDVARGADPYSSSRSGEIHHLTGNQDGRGKGLQMQNRDRYGLPISHRNHRWVHPGPFPKPEDGLTDMERLVNLGIDPIAAADFFWKHSGDRETCLAYMARHIWGRARNAR